MKDIDSFLETAILRGYAIPGSLKVIAEWNYNALFNITPVNEPDDTGWVLNKQYFPATSVGDQLRPSSGIFYAITDEAFTDSSSLGLDANRYYAVDEINKYKYWICPTPSSQEPNPSTLLPDSFDIQTDFSVSRGTLVIDYGQFVHINKLSVTFNLGPMPSDWSFFVFEQTANDWIEIDNPTINAITGKSEVWWNGTSWVESQQLSQTIYQRISKVKLEVRSLAESNKRFQVVELSGRREVDMTSRVQDYYINTSMDDQNYLYPVGRMSANDGKVTFNNNDLALNGEDPSSDFYGALVGWCQYRTYVGFDLTEWGGSSNYLMRTGTMYANDFQQINEYEYQVELFDIFKILQTIDCPALLIENQSIARIIATILDMVGVDNYSFEFSDFDTTNTVKYFWTDGTEKVFEALDKLMKSHQAALFVDDNGVIRLLTRDDIIPDAGETAAWVLKGEKEGLDLPDIIHLKKKYAIQLNKVNIKYTKREAKTDAADIREQPLTSQVWQADNTVVLRAAPLIRDLLAEEKSYVKNFTFDGANADGTIVWDWTTQNCTLTQSNDHAFEGYYSGRIVPNGSSPSVSIQSSKVNAPQSGTLHVTGKFWFTINVTNNFSLSVNWYDANQNYVSTSDTWVSVTAGAWREIAYDINVPNSNIKYATVSPTLRGTPTQIWYADWILAHPAGYIDHWDIWVTPDRAKTWPYKGKVNINGETIEYDGKHYGWWEWTTGVPIYRETHVLNDDERKALDRKSYNSYSLGGVSGGVSSNPTYQNAFSGRLNVIKRDVEGDGQKKFHPVKQRYGWYTMDMWCQGSNSWGFPGKFFTPGGNQYNLDNLKNWNTKVNWTECQSRITVANSILTVDNVTNNSAPGKPSHATVATIDMGDTEYREIGTRLRLRKNTKGQAIIVLYPTDRVGWDNDNPSTSEIFNTNRCYVINVFSTEYCDSKNRAVNEITVQYKNGASLSRVYSGGQVGGNEGKVKIDYDKWYDIEIVYRDGAGENLEGGGFYGARSAIEVYVDGAFVETFYPTTEGSIRPTSLVALGARDTSIVDFEYIYATTTTSKGRMIYSDNDMFDAHTFTLEAGTDVYQNILLPRPDWMGEGVMSFATYGVDATIKDIEVINYEFTSSKKLIGSTPVTLKKDQRLQYQLDDILPFPVQLRIKYTATNPISVCLEYSQVRNYPYGIDNEPVPPPNAYYDILKGGFVSTKANEMFFTPQRYFNSQYLSHNVTTPIYLSYFYDDFGSIAHEVRDFEVDFDPAPAKGVSVYSSNPNSKVVGQKYNPVKGYFTLANTSHRDEIINGTEELDDSNSIDYSLMMYGYVLEEKGDETEEVKNELSIRRHGVISEDLDADWIFTKDEAKALGRWIVDHWGESMDTIEIETFCSIFLEVGDKINVHYPNANINPDWYYIVAGKSLTYDDEGLSFNVTVRRVTP